MIELVLQDPAGRLSGALQISTHLDAAFGAATLSPLVLLTSSRPEQAAVVAALTGRAAELADC